MPQPSADAGDERFRALAERVPVLLWLNGPDGCEFVNRAYLDFLGVHEQTDVRGYDWAQHVHPDDRDRYLQTYLASLAEHAPFSAEFRFRRHDGQYVWMRSIAHVLWSASGEFDGYAGCTFDVHDARIAAAALRLADRRKDEFLATLAHELRSPLAPILNAIELLDEAQHDPQIFRWVRETLQRQVAHVVRLVDDMLDLGRIARGGVELRRRPTDLSPILAQAIETCRPIIEKEAQRLDVSIPDVPVRLDADADRLVQVLVNLIGNASRYSRRGDAIALTVTRSSAAVRISVKDDGIGIPPEKLESIFDMFSQGHPSLEPSRVGLGIGVTLAKQLVELHDGRIEAKSDGPEQGSEFVVTLPILQQPAPAAASVLKLAPQKILVVDDSRASTETLAMLLEFHGHETRVAHDGLEAIAAAEAFRPSVALIDLTLPKLGGLDVCRRIREQPWGRGMTLVTITGWSRPGDQRESEQAGFDGHLVKPIDPDALVRLLARLAARPGLADSSR